MKTLLFTVLASSLAVPAFAQSYPNGQGQYVPPPPQPIQAQPQQVYDPYAPQPMQPAAQPYDPNQDYEEDEVQGYDAQYDVTYDDQAAQGYDDGYDPQAYQQFEGALSPYGSWYDDPSYGRVWMPSANVVGADFSPYSTGGHWVLSEYGWTWVSDWDWGWAPFHYGRWVMCGGYGWGWVPGSVWGPAWVSWRSGGGYVGWSPLPPHGVRIGPPVGVRTPWRFVVANQLGLSRMAYLPAHTVPTVFNRTAVIANTRAVSVGTATVHVNAGPTHLSVGGGVGLSTPVRLGAVAPHALPHPGIAPHAGISVAERPWVRAGVTQQTMPFQRSIPVGVQHPVDNGYRAPVMVHPAPAPRPMPVQQPRTYAPPSYQRPSYGYTQQPGYRAPSYSAPVYHAPAYAQPAYHAPSYPAYRAPTYSAPTYSAPTYSAPHYSAPSYSAPSYSAPHYSAPAPSHSSTTYSRPSTGFSGGGRHR
jgi:hypothetical protein